MDWMRLLGNPRIQLRIDIAEIILTECELPSFNLIENAFQMPDRSMAGQYSISDDFDISVTPSCLPWLCVYESPPLFMQPALSSSSSPAANLLGTITTLVQDTQVDVTRLIYMLYQDVEQQINRADLKAQLTLSTSALLMAMIVNMGPGLRLHSWAGMQIFEYAVLALYSLFIVSMSFAFGCGIAAAFPRAVKKASDINRHPNLYFSGQISKIPGDDYTDLFCQQTNDGVKRSVLGQVHSKCIVLEAKLHNVRKGMSCLVMALILWIAARLVLLIASGLQ